jgi:PrtD family type I secretion system ABC transporter
MKKKAVLKRKQNAKSLLRQGLQASKSVMVSVILFGFFVNLSILAVPFYMLQVYDRVLSSRSESTLVALTLIVLFVLLMFSILDITRAWVMTRTANKMDKYLNPRVFNAVFEHSVFVPGGGHAQALRDLDMVRNFISGHGLFAIFDAPWVPVFLMILFLFHPVVGLLAIFGGLLLFVLALINEIMSRKAYQEISSGTVEATNFTEASLRNSEAIKAMGMLRNIRHLWQVKHSRLVAAQSKSAHQSAIILAMAKYLRLTLQLSVMGTAAYFVIAQEMTPGSMIGASILMGRALSPLEQAVAQWKGLGQARSAYARLQELLGKMPDHPEGLELPAPSGALTIKQLFIAPPGQTDPILKAVNANLAPGESLGIFGPSGAGKSSLARVLVGVWPPRAGNVRLDDADVFTWNSEQMGKYIGYLPQDVELFDGTVAQNIARYSDAESESIIAAAMMAGSHEMILRLPKGYDTRIGESGSGLSGGQRQRIGLARALFGQPVLVVLDEPNSNLDNEGEQALIKTMQNLKQQGTTVVVIAHRPNLLRQVDKIMFLRGGVMEAFGPRQEILQKLLGPAMAAGNRRVLRQQS